VQTLTTVKRGALYPLLICFSILSGCSKVTSSSELVGKYEAHHENGVETLELHANGTYTHNFKPLSGKEALYSSTWRLDPYGGEPKVFLDNFVQDFPGSLQTDPVGTLVGVEKRWGRIRLYVSYDRGFYYTKISTK
jgi:hypothetical protein